MGEARACTYVQVFVIILLFIRATVCVSQQHCEYQKQAQCIMNMTSESAPPQ